ncbi:ubiquitin carboxyl-terminal hydrolase 17-like [Vigna unguiculata]|uniref:ubiquitin carboxyl-terminal hydrolase 17-like n=1 Tax=Vigna unguiculata TaxID=3917 RepID=UPI0010162C68|nr:ubiquitin carboxyl-terminal hydrolase 17-like [Vigna unguiculata]
MRVTIDLGFRSLVLVAVVCLVLPAISFVLRRRWRRAEARAEEIKRLLVLAEEETVRAETEASYYRYGAVSVPKNKVCAVCFSPTTTRCARCKAVHYCSGKCQIVHWRQGHKEECHPAIATCQTDDLVSDLRKNVADPDYRRIHEHSSQTESTEYATASEDHLSEKSSSNISRAKDDSARDESLQEGNVTGSNSELSSNSFSGFSASTGASESSDDSSVCESVISNEHERSEGHIFVDHTHDTSDTTSSHNDIDESVPLSPKFVSLVDSVDDYPAMHKLYQTTPGLGKEESKLTSSDGSSGLHMRKGSTIEPSTVSSGFWNETLDSTRLKDDSNSDHLPSQGDSFPKSVENNMPGSSSSEKNVVDSSGCADAVSIHNLQTVGSRVSNHVINPTSTLELAESRGLPCAIADTKLVSKKEEHSRYSTQCGNKGIQSGTVTSSRVCSSPKSKNDLETSVQKVSDQFRGSKSSKPFPLAVGSNITGKYSDKGHFPYDLFVKLFNLNRVQLQPFGLINCGNSCYANAVLQCLAFTPPLTAYLLQGLHSKSCANKKWCFTCEFESLILKSKDTKSPISPVGLLSQLQNIGSQLGNGREEDAHEFLRLAVETMQSVCLMDSGDKTSDSLREETNLMGLTFGGYLQSKIKCMKCGGKSERQERMMDLTVEIDGEIATLEDALRQFTTAETLDGENKYNCVRCKSYEKAKKRMTVLEAPNVLTIALKRFKSGKFGKLNKPIQFPEILDLAPFMSGTSDLAIYRLYGVVVHLDNMNAAFSGHYVCYVKNFQSRWFKVDDSVVTSVELESVLAKGAYMLFYARCSPRAPRSIRNSIVSSDLKRKLNGKTTIVKGRLSTVSGAGVNLTCADGSPSLDTMYSNFLRQRRIWEEDSSSDNSSLISSNSDEGSCSTDSTSDSTSTDDFAGYIFGDFGCGSGGTFRNSDSNISPALSSSPHTRYFPSCDI